jgi:hypothetical protein
MVELVDATVSIDSRLRVVGVMAANTWQEVTAAQMLADEAGLSSFIWIRVNPALYYNRKDIKP